MAQRNDDSTRDRRRFLAATGAVAAGGWAAPAVITRASAFAQGTGEVTEPPPPPPPTTCDLREWSQTTSAGSWSVAGDGLSLFQATNSPPTIFASPENLAGITFDGFIEVETTGDDDYIGFLVGYNGPTDTGDDYQDYVLIDWKQGNQSGAIQGLTLRRVQGSGWAMSSGTDVNSEFFQQVDEPAPNGDGSGMTVLATHLGTGRGWTDNVEYAYRIEYVSSTGTTPGNIRVWIEPTTAPQSYPTTFGTGSLVFDVSSTGTGVDFPSGRIAFYNFSQPSVRYRQANCSTT